MNKIFKRDRFTNADSGRNIRLADYFIFGQFLKNSRADGLVLSIVISNTITTISKLPLYFPTLVSHTCYSQSHGINPDTEI
jgi:hypothetical protein